MIKTYNEYFLCESNINEKNIDKNIDKETFLNLYKKNCTNHNINIVKNNRYNEIYRGIDSVTNFLFAHREKSKKRYSLQDYNWSNLLLSNLNSWSEYPKRDKSLIFSSNKLYSSNYGNVYVVIPFDNIKIAICSDYDIWFSFKKFFKNEFYQLSYFNENLDKFFNDNIKNPKDDTNYNNLIYNFKEIEKLKSLISKSSFEKKLKLLGLDFAFDNKFVDKFYNDSITFIEYLNDKMSPNKNNFKLIKYDNNLKLENITNIKKNGTEMWASGRCLLVLETIYELEIKDILKNS